MEDGAIGYEVNQIGYGGDRVGYRGDPKKKAQPKMAMPMLKGGWGKGGMVAYGESGFFMPLFNP
jgi:hypothetical protein